MFGGYLSVDKPEWSRVMCRRSLDYSLFFPEVLEYVACSLSCRYSCQAWGACHGGRLFANSIAGSAPAPG